MFLVTSAFLFVMGLRFVGAAIQELQEQTLVSIHDDGVPDLVGTLGFNGTWEALGIQGTLVLMAMAYLLLARIRVTGAAKRTEPVGSRDMRTGDGGVRHP